MCGCTVEGKQDVRSERLHLTIAVSFHVLSSIRVCERLPLIIKILTSISWGISDACVNKLTCPRPLRALCTQP